MHVLFGISHSQDPNTWLVPASHTSGGKCYAVAHMIHGQQAMMIQVTL